MEKTQAEKAQIAFAAMVVEVQSFRDKGMESTADSMMQALEALNDESLERLYDFVRKA